MPEVLRLPVRGLSLSMRIAAGSACSAWQTRGPAIAGFSGLLCDRHYETIDANRRHSIDRVPVSTPRMSKSAAAKYARVSQAGESERIFFVQDNDVGCDPQDAANVFGVFQRSCAAGEFPDSGVGFYFTIAKGQQ